MTQSESPVASIPDHVPPELVRDFAVEFQGSVDELYPRFDALRDEGRVLWLRTTLANGRIGRKDGGVWFFTRSEDIRKAFQASDIFGQLVGADGESPILLPISLDPPEHGRYRRLLNPLFSPGVVESMHADIRNRMRSLVDEVVPEGGCDFTADIALQFPTRVFTSWIGLPEEETPRFVELVKALVHGTAEENADALAGALEAVNTLVTERLANPTSDLMSQIAAQELDGRRLTYEELMSIAYLLFIAGLDTVTASLSFSFWHLAQSPEDRASIVSGRIDSGMAVEELLRRHSIVNTPRVVRKDAEFAGVNFKKGDVVVVSTAMAGRDPEEHDDATRVHLDRPSPRHFAFGAGPHRCLGSHLARLEMRIALEEWHARIPDYRLDNEATAYGGSLMGLRNLPLRWD